MIASLNIVNDDILQSSNSTVLNIWLGSLKDYNVVIKPDYAGTSFRIAKVLYQWSMGFLGLRTAPSTGNYKYFSPLNIPSITFNWKYNTKLVLEIRFQVQQ